MGTFRIKEVIQDENGIKRENLRIFDGNYVSVERSIKPSTSFYEEFDLSALTGGSEGTIKMLKVFCERAVGFDKKPEKCNVAIGDTFLETSELVLYDVDNFADGKLILSKEAVNAVCNINLTIVY